MTADQCQVHIEETFGSPDLPNQEITYIKDKNISSLPQIWFEATYWMINIPTNLKGEVNCGTNGGTIIYPWTWIVGGVKFDIPEVPCLGLDAASCCGKVMAEIKGKGIPMMNDEGKCLSCWVNQEQLQPILPFGGSDVVYIEHMASGDVCTTSELTLDEVKAVDADVEAKLVTVREVINKVVDEGSVLCSDFQDLYDGLLLYGRAFPLAMSRIPHLMCGICEDLTDIYELTITMKDDLLWIRSVLKNEVNLTENSMIIYTDRDGYVVEPPKIGGICTDLYTFSEVIDMQYQPAFALNAMPTIDLNACTGEKVHYCGCPPEGSEFEGVCTCPTCVCPGVKIEDADGNCVCPSNRVTEKNDCPDDESYSFCPDICSCPSDKQEVLAPCARCPDWMGYCRCPTFCVCIGGKVEDGDGNCVCPEGKYEVDGECVCPPGSLDDICFGLPCPEGTNRQPDGSCLCPEGMTLDSEQRCVCDVGVMNQEGNGCVEPVDACPEGTSYDEKLRACISCNCGFCPERSLRVGDWEDCCKLSSDNKCHSSGKNRNNRGCNFPKNGLFYPGYSDQKGSVCGRVEVTIGAHLPIGCGCKPNPYAPCIYFPNDESRCFVCSVEDLADNSECFGCRDCLAENCQSSWVKSPKCVQLAKGKAGTAKEWEDCLLETTKLGSRGLRSVIRELPPSPKSKTAVKSSVAEDKTGVKGSVNKDKTPVKASVKEDKPPVKASATENCALQCANYCRYGVEFLVI